MLINKYPKGIIKVNSSKSIAHRVLITSFVYVLKNIEKYKSIDEIKNALVKLEFEGEYGNDILETVQALNWVLEYLFNKDYLLKKTLYLNIKESASTLRFLIPVLSFLSSKYNFKLILRLGERLKERGLDVYETLFNSIIDKKGNAVFLFNEISLEISGDIFLSEYIIEGNYSSQYTTGLIFLSILKEKEVCIKYTGEVSSKPYLKITKEVLRDFNINVEIDIENKSGNSVKVLEPINLINKEKYFIEGDYSNGALFLCGAALGLNIEIDNLPFRTSQGDSKIIEILTMMGAKVYKKQNFIKVSAKKLIGIDIDVDDIPDLVPILAVVMSVSHGTSRLLNARRLRNKESDRLNSIKEELSKLGADITIKGDDLIINGVDLLLPNKVDSHNDHRIAGALVVASVIIENNQNNQDSFLEVTNIECIKKSYPEFLNYFS